MHIATKYMVSSVCFIAGALGVGGHGTTVVAARQMCACDFMEHLLDDLWLAQLGVNGIFSSLCWAHQPFSQAGFSTRGAPAAAPVEGVV